MTKFIVKSLPPSYNNHFKINYNSKQVYLTKEAKLFKTLVKTSMPPLKFPEDSLFNIEIRYYYSWYYKNSKPRKLDIQNLDKILLDAIFEKLGTDDCRVWILSAYKVHTEELPYTEITIDTL